MNMSRRVLLSPYTPSFTSSLTPSITPAKLFPPCDNTAGTTLHHQYRSSRARASLHTLGVLALAVGLATNAQAQQGQQPLEEITVTGSRITRSGMETPTPVTAVQMDQLETLAPGNLIEAMNQLPQFLNNSSPQNVGSVTGPLGASNLNLRGVGSNRTLVLLDGRRVAPSSKLGVPDISTFPEAMLRNVEVVTGGASAAYGSDAISGVVNYILDTDFTGVRAHVQSGITSRSDNENHEISFSFGHELGANTHVLASADFYKADGIETYDDRNWYRNWGTVDINGPGAPTIIAEDVHSRLYTAGGLIRQPGSQLDMVHFLEGGVPVQFQDGSIVGATRQVGGTGFYGDIGSKEEDQGGLGGLFADTERGSAFLYVDHDFNAAWTGFAQYIYGRNEIDYAQTGAHQETAQWRATLYQDNAFLPDSIRQVMIDEGRDSVPFYRYASQLDLSRARGNQENESNSYTVGLDGEVEDIRVRAYYQYGDTESVYTARDFARLDRLYEAMDAVVNPATGAIVCRSTLSFPNNGCIPANPLGPGTMSNEAVDYILEGDMYRISELTQHFAEISADTEVFDNWGPGPISIAAGASWREDSFDQFSGPQHLVDLDVVPSEQAGYRGLPDSFVGDNLLQFSGVGDDAIGGKFDVWEVFAETLVPLVVDAPFAQSIDLNAAYRYADYSGSGGVRAWKVGLDWRLNDSVRFRVTRSRDTRAATLAERFDQSGGGATAYDPVLDQTYSFSQLVGGNPTVDPELADTWTAGVVLTPAAVPDLAFSVDFYDIKIRDYIAQLGVQRIIDDCFAGAVELCQQITRDPVSGQLDTVSNLFLNVAQARVNGVDMEASWNTDVSLFADGGESLDLRLFASYLAENSFSNIGVAPRDDAGTTNLPEWTATAIATYRFDQITASLTGRWIDSRIMFSDPIPRGSQTNDNTVSSVFYMNARLEYGFDMPGLAEASVFLNVANLADRDPPAVPGWSDFFGASSTVPNLHDPLGRRFVLGLEVQY